MFLAWHPLIRITMTFPEINAQNIVNHCRFYGLYEKRDKNLRGVCTAVMERGFDCLSQIKVDAHAVLKAAELGAKLDGKLQTGNNTNVNVNVAVGELQKKREENWALAQERLKNVIPSDN